MGSEPLAAEHADLVVGCSDASPTQLRVQLAWALLAGELKSKRPDRRVGSPAGGVLNNWPIYIMARLVRTRRDGSRCSTCLETITSAKLLAGPFTNAAHLLRGCPPFHPLAQRDILFVSGRATGARAEWVSGHRTTHPSSPTTTAAAGIRASHYQPFGGSASTGGKNGPESSSSPLRDRGFVCPRW